MNPVKSEEAVPLINKSIEVEQELVAQHKMKRVQAFKKCELKILSQGYCHAMQAGAISSIYATIVQFERILRSSNQESSINAFYYEFYNKAKQCYPDWRAPVITSDLFLKDLNALDEDNLWIAVCFFQKYSLHSPKLKLSLLLHLKNDRLLRLGCKLRRCMEVWDSIKPLQPLAIFIRSLCQSLRSVQTIEEKRFKLCPPVPPVRRHRRIFATVFQGFLDGFRGKTGT